MAEQTEITNVDAIVAGIGANVLKGLDKTVGSIKVGLNALDPKQTVEGISRLAAQVKLQTDNQRLDALNVANGIANMGEEFVLGIQKQTQIQLDEISARRDAMATEKVLAQEAAREQQLQMNRMLEALEALKDTNAQMPEKIESGEIPLMLIAALGGVITGIGIGIAETLKDIFKGILGKDSFIGKQLERLKKAFGKNGNLAKGIRNVRTFFTDSKLFKTIDNAIDTFKAALKNNAITRFFGRLKLFFMQNKMFRQTRIAIDSIRNIFGSKGGLLNSIDDFVKPIRTLFGGGKVVKPFTDVIAKFKDVFKYFKNIGKIIGRLFLPFTIVMGLFETFTGAFDAFKKKGDDDTRGFGERLLDGIGGGLKAILDFFIFDLAKLIEDGVKFLVTWFMGLFGVEEETIKAVSDFSLVDNIRDAVMKAVDYLVGLFKFEDTSFSGIAKSLFDIVFAPLNLAINFVKDLFGWGDPEEPFRFSTLVVDVFNSAVTWVKNLFSDPVGTLTTTLESLAAGVGSFADFITAPLKDAIAWVLKLFGWDEAAEATETFSFKDSILGVFKAAKEWVMSIFTWSQEPVKEEDSIIVKSVKTVVQTIKDWFGNLFKFDSGSDIIKSIVNVLTFMPNLVAKGVTAVTAWFAKLLGFNEESEAIAKAGKEFSFGDLLMDAVKNIADWFGNLLDIDVMSIVKKIPGGETLMRIFSGGEADKAQKQFEQMGLGSEGIIDDFEFDLKALQEKLVGMSADEIKKMASGASTMAAAGDLENVDATMKIFQNALENAPQASTGGLIVGTGYAKIHEGEIMLDNQAATVFMKAAQLLSNSQALEQARMGSGSPVIINNVDNSQRNPVVSNQATQIKVPDNPRPSDPTMLAVQGSQMFN